MRPHTATRTLGFGMVIALGACVAAEKAPIAEGQVYSGWYMEHAGQGVFQLCGQSHQWRVSGSTELSTKAEAFDLGEDTPVYVRLVGVQSAVDNTLVVTRVEQFGSETPVRDCGMTGIVIPVP